MKYLHRLSGITTAFCLMIILFITSVEAVIYWTPGYFEQEYTKYNVLDRLPPMTMEDLLDVTSQMMDYLKGRRQDLHVITTMGGEQREFFNEREIAHMEDVQALFLKAIFIRRVCLGLSAVLLLFMAFTRAWMKRVLWPSLCAGTGLFFGAVTVLALVISANFTKYFVLFHHIFFTNDLWILNPDTDMLINIVPEGFFMDTAGRIALLFGFLSLLLFGICLALTMKHMKKERG
ncbi:MAG: TIGR01906 family membrane protein [Clostridiaceae bacterium]|uniref:TIGR01906 family membrane protein n=1 Tax=Clostridium porci TaxID=2605778 RepID=A0A7X2NLJ4_9CLOT|nr:MULTISPECIES: TIGR01906 family membrane protein [Clostridium]MCI6139705.1 TIGR01906 family membrane protein [Clostridium sp.]MDY3231024.1 TIGR01906 family membrane protein [Clostridiaceae bacterium]MSS37079.1 TIGR01906 family membrane protein [Clostridium porci]